MPAGRYLGNSGMGYPSHLHEIERSFAGIPERIMRKE